MDVLLSYLYLSDNLLTSLASYVFFSVFDGSYSLPELQFINTADPLVKTVSSGLQGLPCTGYAGTEIRSCFSNQQAVNQCSCPFLHAYSLISISLYCSC